MEDVQPRAGETGEVAASRRSSRLHRIEGQWYIRTREGTDLGPYLSRQEARQGLENFMEFMALAPPHQLSRLYAALDPKQPF